jgi:protein phosphatase
MTAPQPTAPQGTAASPARRPLDEELDVYGMTHQGRVRTNNQDHFLIGSLRRHLAVHLTSLPEVNPLTAGIERVAFLAMVADGVGGGPKGEEASRLAVEMVTDYVMHSMNCYYSNDTADEEQFSRSLMEAALQCHMSIAERADHDPSRRGMATTLTLWLSVWPRGYLLQVGDSRCYVLRNSQLAQISRDQTMAQDLIDQGVLTRTDAYQTRWANVLASAIGGSQAMPVVTRLDHRWGDVGLLCSDGLTKHVSDERIRERLRTMTSSKQACERLIEDALAAGGTDNVTVLIGRTVAKK